MSSQAETAARLSDAEIQARLADAVRRYAERAAERDGALPAFPAQTPMTATDVMIAATAMLKAVNVQIFELGMWQAWAGK
jgi:hypothetical protein